MYIYEFMAGKFELITGGEQDDNFDPHKHRKILKPTTYSETMIHLIKGSVGAGVLAIPSAMDHVGLVIGAFGIFFIGFFATYCIHMLIVAQYELCKRHRRGYMAYDKSMRLALVAGPPCMRCMSTGLGIAVNVMLMCWQVGLCAVYFMFAAENLVQVLAFFGYHVSLRMTIFYLFIPQLLMNLVKDLKWLTPISMISNMLIMVGLLLVLFYLVETDVTVTDEMFMMKDLIGVPIFVGVVLFALEAVGVVLALEYNMEKPEQFTGLCGLFSLGMSVIIGLFMIIGLFGYIKYGADAKASLTLNLPKTDKKAQISKFLMGLALYLSIPLQNFVAHQIVMRKTRKRVKRWNKAFDYFTRIFLVILEVVMSVTMPSLGGTISLVGAFSLSLLGVVFPAMIDMGVHYTNYGFANYILLRDIIIIALGMFCFVSGVYTSILEILSSLKKDK